MNNFLKKTLSLLGIFLIVLVLGNFAINFLLKYRLPNYLKNNSNYEIKYDQLDISLRNGEIFATNIFIKSKDTTNTKVVAIDGHIDTLKMSRINIWDAVRNKKLNSSDLFLAKPNLKIVLAKSEKKEVKDGNSPVLFKNIDLKNGNIRIVNDSKQDFLNLNKVQLKVTGLKLNEKSIKNKLPIVFDDYNISCENFFYRPNNIYVLKIQNVQTSEKKMILKNFQFLPLISFATFKVLYPKENTLYRITANSLEFKDIKLDKKHFALSKVVFQNPNVQIFGTVKTSSTENGTEKKEQSDFDIALEDFSLNNAEISIYKNEKRILDTHDLNLSVSKFKFNKKTAKADIPFTYDTFNLMGKDLSFASSTQLLKIGAFALNKNSIDLRNLELKPNTLSKNQSYTDASIRQVSLKINHWKFAQKKLKLDAQHFIVDGLVGSYFDSGKKSASKKAVSGIEFPLKLKKIALKNTDFSYVRNGKPYHIKGLNAVLGDFEINDETAKKELPFKVKYFSIGCKNIESKDKWYTYKIGSVRVETNGFRVSNFSMLPHISRDQFVKSLQYSEDLYSLTAQTIDMRGRWNLLTDKKFINASLLTLDGVSCTIFESDRLPVEQIAKSFYGSRLAKIEIPLYIAKTKVSNSAIYYELENEQATGTGKLSFLHVNGEVQNINSAKVKGKPTLIKIAAHANFLKTAPLVVQWNMDTANPEEAFSVSGTLKNLPASDVSAFVLPYFNVETSGNISNLNFAFKGNINTMSGSMSMDFTKLKVNVLRVNQTKNVLLSALTNMFVRTNSTPSTRTAGIHNLAHIKHNSFFGFFWKGIQEGLFSILIDKNYEKKKVKKQDRMEKRQLKAEQKKAEIDAKALQTVDKPAKEGFFKKMFKKKKSTDK